MEPMNSGLVVHIERSRVLALGSEASFNNFVGHDVSLPMASVTPRQVGFRNRLRMRNESGMISLRSPDSVPLRQSAIDDSQASTSSNANATSVLTSEGDCDNICNCCGASFWFEERLKVNLYLKFLKVAKPFGPVSSEAPTNISKRKME